MKGVYHMAAGGKEFIQSKYLFSALIYIYNEKQNQI